MAKGKSEENRQVSPKALCPVLASLPTHNKDQTSPGEFPPFPNPQDVPAVICPPCLGELAEATRTEGHCLFHVWGHGVQGVRQIQKGQNRESPAATKPREGKRLRQGQTAEKGRSGLEAWFPGSKFQTLFSRPCCSHGTQPPSRGRVPGIPG